MVDLIQLIRCVQKIHTVSIHTLIYKCVESLNKVVELIDSLKFVDDNIVTWKAGVKRIIKRYIKII